MALALLILALGCRSGPGPVDPALHLTRALCSRAEDALADGRAEVAREAAHSVLERTAATPSPHAERGRALAVLGRLDHDPDLLARALAELAPLGPTPALADLRLHLAESALAARRPAVALEQLLALREELRAPAVRSAAIPDAQTLDEAEAEHRLAVARRALGEAGLALEHERQAALLLTRLPDESSAALRLAVRGGLAGDWLRAGHPAEAFRWHARAAALAQELGRDAEWLTAVVGMADAQFALGRDSDARDHALRALALAERLGDAATRAAVERRLATWFPGDEPPP